MLLLPLLFDVEAASVVVVISKVAKVESPKLFFCLPWVDGCLVEGNFFFCFRKSGKNSGLAAEQENEKKGV